MSANLRLGGLSIACDLGFGLPPEEAMRSCLIATGLARRLEMSEPEVADTFYTVLLTHVGCSALSHETAAAWGDELQVLSAVARTNVADATDIAGTVSRSRWRERAPRSAPGLRSSPPAGRDRTSAGTSTPAAVRWPARPRGASGSARAPSGR